jgi:hypothetical protein
MSLINVDWDFALLDELIEARGDDVVVETGVACTCRNQDLYASTILRHESPASFRRMNCEKCQGDSFVYRNPRCVRGLLTGLDPGRNKALLESGYAIPGDSVFSPERHAEHIADFDKITLMVAQDLNEGQIIMRNAAHMEENAQIPTELTEDEDRLWYVADLSVWCEDEDGVIYAQDADFEFDSKKIRWIGNRPDEGKLYSVRYTGFPEWIVYSQPFLRVDRGRSLGRKVLLRKKHVHYNSGSQAATPEERLVEAEAFTSGVKI